VKEIKPVWITAVAFFIAIGLAGAAESDKKGCADHPVFPTRMSGYIIRDCETKDFDAFQFETGKREKNVVEGRRTKLIYWIQDRSKEPSALAIVRNYENAIKSVGGTVLFLEQNRWVNGKIVKDGKEIWAQAERGNGQIWLNIVEKAGMVQEIVANAEAFSNNIKATGHAAIYGIHFDTGKSVIKPESDAALAEIVKLLNGDANLKVNVVGHTDSVGGIESNMKLSQDRANAVVQALIGKHGIEANRLKAYGVGPLSPVASNDTEEGKAKNRRVELVKQ